MKDGSNEVAVLEELPGDKSTGAMILSLLCRCSLVLVPGIAITGFKRVSDEPCNLHQM